MFVENGISVLKRYVLLKCQYFLGICITLMRKTVVSAAMRQTVVESSKTIG